MCLSAVFEVKGSEERLACENVTAISNDNGVIRLTDIMGNEVSISGVLRSIDLVKNIIKIDI